jgi:hypothetical protein
MVPSPMPEGARSEVRSLRRVGGVWRNQGEPFDTVAAARTWLTLQRAVTMLLDSSKARKGEATNTGIRQQLEKKEGLFRKNMMVRCSPVQRSKICGSDCSLCGRSLTRQFRHARRFPYFLTDCSPCRGLHGRRDAFGICPSFKAHFLSPRANP